jgi:predicted RNA-binding Zn-ribbon protein involved in translation (DUF1610 family)
MGSQVKAKCTCGYEKTSLVGGGKLSYKTIEYFPCYCNKCQEIVQGNLKASILSCPNCGSQKIFSYNNNSLISSVGKNIVARSFDNVITDGYYKCPKCLEMTLQFFLEDIIWD